MNIDQFSLSRVYDGWDGYQTSLLKALEILTDEQIAYRSLPELRSVGEIFRHIALGRLEWFLRMDAPGSAELAKRVPEWHGDDGNRYIVATAISLEKSELIIWLESSWSMIAETLNTWTVADLERSFRHTYFGNTYAVSYQWVVWRILCNDIQHGGQLSMLLYRQGIEIPELGNLGGHLTEPPIIESGPK